MRVINTSEFDVEVTMTFRTNVNFDMDIPENKNNPPGPDAAMANFLGYGLSDVMDSGEYGVIINKVTIERTE